MRRGRPELAAPPALTPARSLGGQRRGAERSRGQGSAPAEEGAGRSGVEPVVHFVARQTMSL
jgi:hypothetical protein